MEAFIHFLIQHNERIIAISAGVIGFLAIVVVAWQVFGKKQEAADAQDVNLKNIEESLMKILSQTNAAIGSVSGAMPAADGTVPVTGVTTLTGQPVANLEELKKELEARADLIKDLQQKVDLAKSPDASSELLAKIKNLEGKLLEYEIIEDDIADLSHFKEENAKLKAELDAIKRGGGAKLVDQFADVLAQQEAAVSAPMSPQASVVNDTPAPAEEPFETLLQKQSGQQPTSAEAVPSATDLLADDAADAIVSAQVEEVATGGTGVATEASAEADIFGEFSGEATGEEDPLAALGDIDADRMLDELRGLNAELQVGSEALEEPPDIDKMADEAVNLKKN